MSTYHTSEFTCLSSSVVDPDPHGSGTFDWIRIRNKSFRIHNTAEFFLFINGLRNRRAYFAPTTGDELGKLPIPSGILFYSSFF